MDPLLTGISDRLEAMHQTIEEAIADLTVEALDWVPGPGMNSIAVLLAHTFGSERYWIGDVAGEDPSGRVRAKEFETAGVKVHPYTATFFVSQVQVSAPGGGIRRIPAKLFALMSRNASSSVEFYRLPPERVLSVGARIDI